MASNLYNFQIAQTGANLGLSPDNLKNEKLIKSGAIVGPAFNEQLIPLNTITVSPTTSTDDANYGDSSNWFSIIASDIRCGIVSSGFIGVFLFRNLNWNEATTITSTSFKWYCNGVGTFPTRTVEWSIYGGAYDDITMPTTFNGFLNLAKTTAFTLYSGLVSSKTVGNIYEITGFETPVNEVISRPGWVAGNNLMLIIFYGPGCSGNAFWDIGSYDGYLLDNNKPPVELTLIG